VRLACCRHNAKVYGVAERMEFVLADYYRLIPRLRADVVFLAPPWGGPQYADHDLFDIETMLQPSMSYLYRMTKTITDNIAILLPKNSDKKQIAHLATLGSLSSSSTNSAAAQTPVECEIETCYYDTRPKCIVAYFGQLAQRVQTSSTSSSPSSSASGAFESRAVFTVD